MRRFLPLLLLCPTLLLSQVKMVTITASNISDAANRKLARGVITFSPTDANGNPILSELGGATAGVPAGQILPRSVSAYIVNGAITFDTVTGNTFQVADTSATFPQHVCFKVTVTDTSTKPPTNFPPYACVQPAYTSPWCTAGVCNWDNFQYPNGMLPILYGSLSVNGNVVGGPNFNGATPPAPSGSTNVTWQYSGPNVSGYVTTPNPLPDVVDTPGTSLAIGVPATIGIGASLLSGVAQPGSSVTVPLTACNGGPCTWSLFLRSDLTIGCQLKIALDGGPCLIMTQTAKVTDFAPVSGDVVLAIDDPFPVVVTRIWCGVSTGISAAVDLKTSSEAAIGTLGSSILSGPVTCPTSGSVGSVISGTLSAHTPLMLSVGAVTGSPAALYVQVEYTRAVH